MSRGSLGSMGGKRRLRGRRVAAFSLQSSLQYDSKRNGRSKALPRKFPRKNQVEEELTRRREREEGNAKGRVLEVGERYNP